MCKGPVYWLISTIVVSLIHQNISVTMKQFEASLDMLRSGCAPKFQLSTDILDDLRKGKFIEDNKDLKCYTKCVAQLSGTLTKKGEFSFQKALAQIPILLPPEIQETARKALEACISIQKNYSDSCDKIFYTTKCAHDFNPKSFLFP